jgi:hypothetical protein
LLILVSPSTKSRDRAARKGEALNIRKLLSEHVPNLKVVETRSNKRAIVKLSKGTNLDELRNTHGDVLLFSNIAEIEPF